MILVWLYLGAGERLSVAALGHAASNFATIGPTLDFGPGGYPLAAQRIAALILVVVAALASAA